MRRHTVGVLTLSVAGLALARPGIPPLPSQRTVELGDRWLTEPIVLTPADSNTRFVGRPGSAIRGGVRIEGWTDRGNGVWGAKLPVDGNGKPLYFEQLWVNGRRAQRARFPDKGFLNPRGFRVMTLATGGYRQMLTLGEAAIPLFEGVQDDELPYAQFVIHTHWDFTRRPIDALIASNRTLIAHGSLPGSDKEEQCWCKWDTNDLCYVENIRSAFDCPGEWFYDAKAGEVLYRPNAKETIQMAVAPVDGLVSLVVIKGDCEKGAFVENVTFENVTFEFSSPVGRRGPARIEPYQAAMYAGSAVLADGARNVVFDGCRFRHTGGYALWLRRGCMSNVVTNCRMTDLGAGGVRIGEFDFLPRKEFENPGEKSACVEVRTYTGRSTAFNRIEDCQIGQCGRYHPSGVGILIGHASDNVITHNDITDLYYTGISVGWSWGYSGSVAQRNKITYNRIWKVGQHVLADMGGIYTLGTSFGTVVSNNVVHDVRTYFYGGWGLYMDEGSEGIVMENNLVYDTDDNSFYQHYGRNNVIRNNIGVNGRRGAISIGKQWRSNREHVQYTAERNVLVWSRPTAPLSDVALDQPCVWKSNLWWCSNGPVVFPGNRDFSAWQAKSGEKGGRVADPLFCNPEMHDYRLRTDSPAFDMGFRAFDPAQAGRRKNQKPNL